MADSRFKIIDHPSDIGIIAFGKTRTEIFENAAYGMFSVMADLEKVRAERSLEIKIQGDDLASLLVNWLNELIFNEDVRKMLFCKFKIGKLTDTLLEAVAFGEMIDLDRHTIFRPVKAATYNQLQISKNQARIIFDV